jgi:rhodanese-related sulfurtransferase
MRDPTARPPYPPSGMSRMKRPEKRIISPGRGLRAIPAWILVIIFYFTGSQCLNHPGAGTKESSEQFETVRAYVQSWLAGSQIEKSIISSSFLKEKIVDDWNSQSGHYQLISVRKPDDFGNAGHIPHAINIYWVDILKDENLHQLDTAKTQILYCYYGHGSMIVLSILSLLGYTCKSLNFGMMDWNPNALVKASWDQEADYAIETTINSSKAKFTPPVLTSNETDIKQIIRERASQYLEGEGSPVISAAEVKAVIDSWENEKGQYQIIDVRKKNEYRLGHIPHAINIPWEKICEKSRLNKIDPEKISVIYSENGQTGQMVTTLLCLLGYRSVNLKFGMMDWNMGYVDKSMIWNGGAYYPVER